MKVIIAFHAYVIKNKIRFIDRTQLHHISLTPDRDFDGNSDLCALSTNPHGIVIVIPIDVHVQLVAVVPHFIKQTLRFIDICSRLHHGIHSR
ncbi:hypothetical protein D3C85_889160 [compost metagenome]